jgi:hypothetical protein
MAKGQKYNPEWADSKEARKERQATRRAALLAKLAAAGWDGESEFLTAIIKGVVEVPQKPKEK